jgi:hypothetical protein
MSQVDTERATALRTNPWYNTVQEDGTLEPITPVNSSADEIQAFLEAVLNDFPITPGTAHSFDRVKVVTGPTVIRNTEGSMEIGRERQVYLRHAVDGRWFMVPLKVYYTDLPNGTEYEEAMGG